MGTVPSNTSGNIKYYNDNDAIYKGDNVSIKDNDRIKDLNKSSSNAVGASRQTDKQKMTIGISPMVIFIYKTRLAPR